MESALNTARFSSHFRPEVVMPPSGRTTAPSRESARLERYPKRPVNYRHSANLHARDAGVAALFGLDAPNNPLFGTTLG